MAVRTLLLVAMMMCVLSAVADGRRSKEAADTPATPAASVDGSTDFPRVARNQTRGWTVVGNPEEQCITYSDGSTSCDDYDPAACNCKRKCEVYTCKLSTSTNDRCAIPVSGSYCHECDSCV